MIGFSCCDGCQKRHLGCHDRCPDRAVEVAENALAAARKRAQNEVDQYVIEEFRRSKRRAGRR